MIASASAILALLLATAAADDTEINADELIQQAKVLARKQDGQGALERLIKAQSLAPTAAEPLTLEGNVHTYVLRDAARGESAYRKAIALDPSAWDASFFLARCIASQGGGRAEEAALAFDAAAELKPSNLAGRLEQGAAWAAAGSYARASEAFLAAAAADPHSPQPLLARARAAASAGAPPAAVLAAWRDASETFPWTAPTLIEHAEAVLLSAGSSADAEEGNPEDAPSPTACELVAAALLLDPDAALPPRLRRACDAERQAAAGKQPSPTDAEAAAVAALKYGACASLARCAPRLAPFATASGGADRYGRPRADRGECVVRAPVGLRAVRFSCAEHGLHVPRGLALSVAGTPDSSSRASSYLSLDAGSLSRHFLAEGALSLSRVRLAHGRVALSSGGSVLLLPNATLSATDCAFESNRAALGSGGAIAALGSASVALLRVAFRRNSASWCGGAISMQRTGEGRASLSLRGVGGVGGDGGGVGDESGGHVAASSGGVMVWEANGAGFGGADIHLCPESLLPTAPGGVRFAACAELGGAGMRRASAVSVRSFEALEAQAAADELQGVLEVDATVALALLGRATASDPLCPTATMARLSLLYGSGCDAQAAALLDEWEARQPGHPTLDPARAVLSHASAGALLLRAQRLTAHAAAMREGRPSAAEFRSRNECQDFATDAFLRAVILSPSDGDIWHALGSSLFFAGELAESERVYAEGLRRAPRHAKLIHEAVAARAFAPAAEEATAAAAGGRRAFGDADFERVLLPEGSYADRPASADLHMKEDFFGPRPSAFLSKSPLLLPDECARAVAAAEAWAAANGGWTTKRHYSVPTTDVPLSALPELLPWFNPALATKLFPALLSRYPQAAAAAG